MYFDLMREACNKEGLELDEKKYNQFMQYKNLIQEWNEKVNLTAITEDEEMVKKHFIDSLKAFSFKPLHNATRMLDVGTGAGFPGIPIKIIKPELRVTLLDSLNKRVIFLNEVIKTLGLSEIEAIHGRAEDFAREKIFRERFDIVVSRAVANMAVLSEFCLPFVSIGGYFIAMKGPSIDEELIEGKKAINALGGAIEKIIQVNVEGTELKHNLVVVKKVANTTNQYPRKAGMITKKPLK